MPVGFTHSESAASGWYEEAAEKRHLGIGLDEEGQPGDGRVCRAFSTVPLHNPANFMQLIHSDSSQAREDEPLGLIGSYKRLAASSYP